MNEKNVSDYSRLAPVTALGVGAANHVFRASAVINGFPVAKDFAGIKYISNYIDVGEVYNEMQNGKRGKLPEGVTLGNSLFEHSEQMEALEIADQILEYVFKHKNK